MGTELQARIVFPAQLAKAIGQSSNTLWHTLTTQLNRTRCFCVSPSENSPGKIFKKFQSTHNKISYVENKRN